MFKPLVLLATQIAPTLDTLSRAAGDVYIRAERSSLPYCAPDMLIVRIG